MNAQGWTQRVRLGRFISWDWGIAVRTRPCRHASREPTVDRRRGTHQPSHTPHAPATPGSRSEPIRPQMHRDLQGLPAECMLIYSITCMHTRTCSCLHACKCVRKRACVQCVCACVCACGRTRCFWPPLSVTPRSPTSVRSPASHARSDGPWSLALFSDSA